MGQNLEPRRIRSGPYLPTVPRSGNESDNAIWRKNNLITRGREGRFYEETYSGEGILTDETFPSVQMTGTLAISSGSNEVVGTGTLFLTECPYIGQRIALVPTDNSVCFPIFVKHVVDDTHMTVWANQTATVTGLNGWLMPRLYMVNEQRGVSTWGNVIKLDRGSYLGVGLGTFYINGATLPGTSMVLSRKPSIALYDPVANTYTTFNLGMNTPPPPSLCGRRWLEDAGWELLICDHAREKRDVWVQQSFRSC